MADLLINILGVNRNKHLSVKEKLVMEIIIFKHICGELKNYFVLKSAGVTCKKTKENGMADGQMIGKLVNDLLENNEYSIRGLSSYTGYPEDVIYDLASGLNCNPTIDLSNKLIELHFFARRELYISFLKKII